jgi:hypothetical protein
MKKYFLILCSVLLFAACREERVLDFIEDLEPAIVVEGRITNAREKHFIRLTRSTGYYNVTQGERISGADVSINGIDLIEDSAGVYSTPINFIANPGNTYILNIEFEGKKYTASGFMPPLPDLDSITITRNRDVPDFVPVIVYDVNAFFIEDGNRKDRYVFDLYLNGELTTREFSRKTFFEDDFLIPGPVSFAAVFFSDQDIPFEDSIEVVLEMRSLNRENYKFYLDFLNQTDNANNPFFAPPPANISTNLSVGAAGFFEVSAVSRDTLMFKHQ